MSQMKGQDKISEKQLHEVHIGNLPTNDNDSEEDLRNEDLRMEKMQEMFIKDLEELKNQQTETHNTFEGINSRITEAEE